MSFGHSIAVSFKRTDYKTFEFNIYNTGMGSIWHQRTEEGEVSPLTYTTEQPNYVLHKLFEELVDCSDLPLTERAPVNRFYNCFARPGFKSVNKGSGRAGFVAQGIRSDALSTQQNAVNSCTQFSVRAYLKDQMADFPGLHQKFNEFMIEDSIRKCERYIETIDSKHQDYMVYYKHPALKPRGYADFLLIWILSVFVIENKIRLREGHLAAGISKKDLTEFVQAIKDQRQKISESARIDALQIAAGDPQSVLAFLAGAKLQRKLPKGTPKIDT